MLCDLNFEQANIDSLCIEHTQVKDSNNESVHVKNTNSRKVVTSTVVADNAGNETTDITPTVNEDNAADTDAHRKVVTQELDVDNNNNTDETPKRPAQLLELDSQTESTPCSVITDPDAVELEAANLLLQLGKDAEVSIPDTPRITIDDDIDNEKLLPVNAPRMENFSKDIAENRKLIWQPKQSKENDTDTDDSQKTVDYVHDSNNNNKDNRVMAANDEEVSSPKGRMKIKHYGIIRQSPKAGPAYHRCCYCEGDEVFHSKKELNNHHRMVHTKVKCPDCVKIFPTPDALQ